MEETYLTKAIILNRKPWQENGLRVSVYSRERGKLELIARGARKASSKFSSHLEPLTFANLMVIRGRTANYVGSSIMERGYAQIKNDYEKLASGGQLIKIFSDAVKLEEKDERLFNFLQSYLLLIEKRESDYDLIVQFFKFQLLNFLGLQPELNNCLVCGKRIEASGHYFNLKKGGVICKNCQKIPGKEELTLSDNCIKVLRIISEDRAEEMLKVEMDGELKEEIIKTINLFYSFQQQ